MGRILVDGRNALTEPVLVSLFNRGAPIASGYTDSTGTYGFHNLPPDIYEVVINDDQYQSVRETAVIQPHSLNPVAVVNISLARKRPETSSQHPERPVGANAGITDAREYSSHFPKQVRKEFNKGVAADQAGKKDDAIRHYEKALKIAPDYYPAHNNLGSDYLSQSDFAGARKEFEQVVRLNQSDAEAYFNLSNVCMITGQLADAQRYLEEGMRREPDSALGHFLLGSLDIKTGKYAQAEAVLRQTVQLSPTMAQARLQLVNLFVQEGRKPEAEAELQDFIKTFPESSFTPKAREILQKLEIAQSVPPKQASPISK
jgi:tetratricopeptide (TPR) repeat protein